MTPLGEIANRWSNSHPAPIFVGAVPEGTPPPHLALTENTTSQVRSFPNIINWNQTSVTITAVANTSVEAGELGDYMEQLFNGVSFGSVADMVMTMRTVNYTDTPTLTGNRGWVAILDFSIRH